ncbi:MAG: HAMP domain-containing histidine kinase [Actinobacteria bacterium]|nr:HAMP domain-containing histidine kinase [Actinomycetota bacterium]MCG2806794.1 HAMP domain-containing histidine kinase [Coriobacteriia bacterium]
MHRSSLRSWLLLVAILFSGLVVGGMALTTYIVVSDGMSVVAHDSNERLARAAAEAVRETAKDAPSAPEDPSDATGTGRSGLKDVVASLPGLLSAGLLSDGQFALYDSTLQPVWSSSRAALIPAAKGQRVQTAVTEKNTESNLGTQGVLRGLVGPSELGIFVVHSPITLPDGGVGVLDAVYYPTKEEAVIDSIRPPMFTLVISAMFIMVIMMQTSMGWVLKLVDDLRKAADSIDSGRLDVRLPVEGEHEIGELARSINDLIDRLRRRADAQTRFVADASHELATPVAGIRGYTNILRAWGGDDPEVREEAISAIDRESRRMARLCSDLLALVRNERGIEFRSVRFDVNARCREVLAAAATRYISKGLTFTGPEEGQIVMMGDPDRIEDAISILVDNAAKYTPEAGRVALRTRRRRDTVIIEVEDTGVGIPVDDLESIFDRFYRSDASRSKETGGFGLGLPIAKTIVDGAGGSIDVHSELGAGTRFTLRLPRGRV